MFHPDVAISRENGGGGNRTRVPCQPETPFSREKANGLKPLFPSAEPKADR